MKRMGSQYDENLNQNPFFNYIQENHCDFLEKASSEKWIICIPRFGTYDTCDLTADRILDHVLIPGSGKDKDVYCTLSRKRVSVENKHIYTDSTDLFSSGTDVLFEETFYVWKAAKYKVWCIDNPLFLSHSYCHSHSNKVLANLRDCVDFLWCESSGHHILDSVKDIVTQFTQECREMETEDLQTQKEIIGKLFSQCLQTGLKSEVIKKKCMSNNNFVENFKLAIETYMQFCLGRKLFFSISTLQHQSDSHLNKILRNCSALQYQDLGISEQFSDTITSAKCEMSRINNCHTVLDKLNCLSKIFSILYEINRKVEGAFITSDDILQVLVFLLLKVQVNNWFANLTFLKEFRLCSLETSDQTSFIITSFEAAIEYVRSNQFLDLRKELNLLNTNSSALRSLCDKIALKDTKPISKLITNNFVTGRNLCHPLCNCTKCQTMKDQDFDWVDLNSKNCNDLGKNLLILATIAGKCDIVEYLLNQNFNVNSIDCFGKTSLHYAASRGYQNILLLLVNRQANVNAKDNEKNTPLHLACLNGHESCVKALIYSTAEVELNIGNLSGETPLHLATVWGYYEIIKILLENGASAIIKSRKNQTVVELAPNHYILKLFEKFGSLQSISIKKALAKTLNVVVQELAQNECSEHGERPKHADQFRRIDSLLKAIEYNDFPLTCFHLGFGSKSKNIISGSCHPLCLCEKCQNVQEDEVDGPQTFSGAVNVNMCNVDGYTPLHIAAKFGRSEILRVILDSGASVNVQTYNTLYTPLHLACIFQRIQIVRELVRCNCKIDKQDCKGNTPLHYASSKNDIKVVQILLDNGANCREKNYFGRSPLQESEDDMQYRIFKLMRISLVNEFETAKESNLVGD